MFLYEMTVSERLKSIAHIATLLAGATAWSALIEEPPSPLLFNCKTAGAPPGASSGRLVLRVVAPGGHEWKVASDARKAEEAVTYSMLLWLAHEAEVCPRCYATVPRGMATRPGDDNERYKCDVCELRWTEQR